jgi:hypothetical protein
MIRPDGPLPEIATRSTSFSRAIFRASGEAKIRVSSEPLSFRGRDDAVFDEVGCGADGFRAEADDGLVADCPDGLEVSSTVAAPFDRGSVLEADSVGGDLAPSPDSLSTRITVPTFTASPSLTGMEATVPSSKLCNSIVALSVSMSAMTSPDETFCPGTTFHFTTVPTSIVSESRGILTSSVMGTSFRHA